MLSESPLRRGAVSAPACTDLRRPQAAARAPHRPAGAWSPTPRSVRLPRAQVQLSLMALYLLPDASFCSFLRISSILTFAGAQPPTTKGAREAGLGTPPPLLLPGPGRLGGRCARSHPAPARRLMNHARSMPRATSVPSPHPSRPAPRPPRSGALPPRRGAGGGRPEDAALTPPPRQALAHRGFAERWRRMS